MEKSIDFTARPTAAYVITSVKPGTGRAIDGLTLHDITCEKTGTVPRLVVYSRDGDAPSIGFHLIHKRVTGGFAAMWSLSAEDVGHKRLVGGGFTIGCIPAKWLASTAS